MAAAAGGRCSRAVCLLGVADSFLPRPPPTWAQARGRHMAAVTRWAATLPRSAHGSTAAPAETPLDFLLRPTRVHDVFNPRLGMEEGETPSWVSDIGKQLPAEDRGELDKLCESFHAQWRAEVAVVVLGALPDDVNPSGFAAALMNFWGVGDVRLHSGLLIMLLSRQRRLEMRVGHGATRVLGPEVQRRIQQDHMVPHFRAGHPGAGLCAGLRAVMSTFEDSGPSHWRRDPAAPVPELNRHGFGGGQTPIDEFMPAKGAASTPESPPAAPGASG